MANVEDPVVDAEISSAEVSCPVSSSSCKPLSRPMMTAKPLGSPFHEIDELDLKHELYPRQDERDLQYQDIPLPPPSINFTSKPGTPSSRISNMTDSTPIRNKSPSGIGLLFNRSEYPTSISQASDFLARDRKLSEMTEKYPETIVQQEASHSSISGALSNSFSNTSIMTTTSTILPASAPSLSSIDADLITQAIAWLDRETPELTLAIAPLTPLNRGSLPSVSNPSSSTIHPPVSSSSNDGLSTTLSIRYCPQLSDPIQLASPPPEYHPDRPARYPFLQNPSQLKACDQDPGPWHDSLCLTVPIAHTKSKFDHTHACSGSPKCQGEMSPKNESSCPAILSAICAIIIPLGCLLCNATWLAESSEKSSAGKAVLALYCYLIIIMLSSMWKAASSDPGIIPRDLDLEPEYEWDEERIPIQEEHIKMKEPQALSQPRIQARSVNIGDYIVPLKWCRRCRTYRPPRASHCRICDFCILQSDHHCTFLNNCIGRKNYFVFLIFLFTTAVAMLSTIAISISHLALMTDPAVNPEAIGNYIVIALAFLLGVPVFGLLVFHMRLISKNVTTTERLRPIIIQENGIESPARGDIQLYSLGKWYSNWLWIVCRPNFTLEGIKLDPLLTEPE
ncbi:Eukaryotic peptide chain release factor GTP-binding subunit [Puccinia graminis f. sp. tritici]|uniref:Palmitoyltransferase n=1 Tax=Puccinia graminis f. sp. tritici TaxID=56615 RepID=A0A5B0P9I6_PUCGR|nr:Eukaryotic peptide chain release factor GTP-binding subunit [Puccinia graminis f. sp. tritici]KAA1134207.1 Eukaryotic peptide chain release factor GTP-binding subunit [Puccinia graminis f. sp. tritici]